MGRGGAEGGEEKMGRGRAFPSAGKHRPPRPRPFRGRATAAGPSGAAGNAQGRPGPSAARIPGAARRPPPGLGSPREASARVRDAAEGSQAGVPATGRRPQGPRSLRVALCHSHFGGGDSGRESTKRRSGTRGGEPGRGEAQAAVAAARGR